MSTIKAAILAGAFAALALPAQAASIAVVAAENFYGDLARQVGGAAVSVTSILSNPDQDPHLFEADPSTARALKDAAVVISNGIDYDPWMAKLLAAGPSPGRQEVVVADLVSKHAGDNPHLWYDPSTMAVAATALAARFAAADPARKAFYAKNAEAFAASLKPLEAKIAAMKARHPHAPVAASEPVFGYMAGLLGLDVHDEAFQLTVMNGTEPSPSDVATFESELKDRKVKALIYNSQADNPTVKRLVGIAEAAQVPVVGVTETEPAGSTYQDWMMRQLDALDRALSSKAS